MSDNDDMRDVRREVRRLWQEVSKRPLKARAGSTSRLYTVSILSGNTLSTGQTGIKYSSSGISDVPSAYDPDVTSSFIDGVGRGTLFIDGVSQTSKVLIVNDLTGGAITFALLVGDIVVVRASRTLTVGGDPNTTVTAYSPLFL
jgi:hypothetical protein